MIRVRHLRIGISASIAGLALVLAMYTVLTNPGPPTQFTQEGNVIIAGIDSYQYNRLEMGGAEVDISPTVNTFLKESWHFTNAWTPLARTYPSWLSILTGRWPMNSGVRCNLIHDSMLSESNRYLPELFRENGYYTFHATDEVRFSVIRAKFGYDHLLHPRMGVADFMLVTFFDFSVINFLRQTHLGHDMFPALALNRASSTFNPKTWTRAFKREINKLPTDKPLFIQFHLCGNHYPFTTIFPYAYRHEGRVDDCISMVDDMIAEILEHLDATGLRQRSTIVMMSDHGDGNNGNPLDTVNTHGDNFDRIIANQIVLGFQGPEIGRDKSSQFVRTMDVYPTLLEMRDIPVPEDIDGESLLPIMRGETVPPRMLYAETDFDKRTYTNRQLIENYASWYDLDKDTGMIYVAEEGYRKLLDMKNYMIIDGDHRLTATPSIGKFHAFHFDHAKGVDRVSELPVSDEEKIALMRKLCDHFKLDFEAMLDFARHRRFIAAE